MLAVVVNPFTAIGVGFAIATALGGLVAYFGQQRAKDVIYLQTVEISTQKDRIDTLEQDNARKTGEITELQTSVRVLRENLTHDSKIDLLVTTSEQQHRAIVVSIDSLTADMSGLTKAITELLHEVRREPRTA